MSNYGEQECLGSSGSLGFKGRFFTTVFEEVAEGSAGYASGPERALLSALLFDGIQSFISYATATTEATKATHREAYNWVMKGSEDYVFSFHNVCEALGIKPEWLRIGLINAANSHLAEIGKMRRNT
jgi:hypothetical protein